MSGGFEYWTLRHAHGDAPLLDRADLLWNSSTVAHERRWDLDLPDRDGVLRYMGDVLERQLERLAGGINSRASYFYELSIRHEDMHVEALAYTRQTLGYSAPENLGRPAVHGAGTGPATSRYRVARGVWDHRPATALCLTTRNGSTRSRLHRSASPDRQ